MSTAYFLSIYSLLFVFCSFFVVCSQFLFISFRLYFASTNTIFFCCVFYRRLSLQFHRGYFMLYSSKFFYYFFHSNMYSDHFSQLLWDDIFIMFFYFSSSLIFVLSILISRMHERNVENGQFNETQSNNKCGRPKTMYEYENVISISRRSNASKRHLTISRLVQAFTGEMKRKNNDNWVNGPREWFNRDTRTHRKRDLSANSSPISVLSITKLHVSTNVLFGSSVNYSRRTRKKS